MLRDTPRSITKKGLGVWVAGGDSQKVVVSPCKAQQQQQPQQAAAAAAWKGSSNCVRQRYEVFLAGARAWDMGTRRYP
jgi:hypothetical protein